jgi:hypothetical protein
MHQGNHNLATDATVELVLINLCRRIQGRNPTPRAIAVATATIKTTTATWA